MGPDNRPFTLREEVSCADKFLTHATRHRLDHTKDLKEVVVGHSIKGLRKI
jgi:hypothetical protein